MKGLFSAAALSLALASPAAATIVQVDASSIQGDNVLFNQDVQTGTTVQGLTQDGTVVNFSGRTVGGGTTIRAQGGQARVEGMLDGDTNNPNDTLGLNMLNFSLASGTFNNLELNLFGASAGSTVDFRITDNEGQIFNFTDLALKNGENFFGFIGILGESIANVQFNVDGQISDVRQVRLDTVNVAAVPGPIAGAGLPALMALGGFVWARRRKATAAA